jgi:hypothetical protein
MSALEPPSKRRYDRIGESTPFDFRKRTHVSGPDKNRLGRLMGFVPAAPKYNLHHVTVAPRNARVAGAPCTILHDGIAAFAESGRDVS